MPTAAATTANRTAPPAAASASNGHPTLGAMDAIRTTLATTVKVIRTRLEVISCELEEQREWMQSLLLFAVLGIFCVCMGLVMLTLFVVAMFWESHPKIVLGAFAGVYLAVGIWAVLTFKGKLGSRPKLFQTTTEELAKDEAQLTPK
ncbi:MAG TPA: phage holin family protein [Verrucomicrobiae bacterium]|nr:phage holin family protein [Verrucomicrobiae bacterium]